MPEIKYILFDCDNTLAMSEKLAFQACAELTNKVLKEYGHGNVEYDGTTLLHEFVGQNFRGMINSLEKKLGFKVPDDKLDVYVGQEVEVVTEKLKEYATECPGATAQVKALHGKIPMAVVSTSAKSRVLASIEKIGIGHGQYWPDEHVYSAATSMPEPSSKPDPKIYNWACEKLGVNQANAVAVEDSKSGATAAMRAGIPCIGYVGIYGIEEGEEEMESKAKLLTETCKVAAIMRDWKEFPDILKKLDPSLVGKI